jgi:single-strand DNA-binding protein
MSLCINQVNFTGNLTRDPETRQVGSSSVTSMTLANTKKYKSKDGEAKEDTCFLDVEAWGKTGELVAKYLTKGAGAYVEGSLVQQSWQDKDGNKRSKVLIRADRIHFIPSGKSNLNDVRAESSGASGGDGMAPGNSVGDEPF